jgi:two-component system, response regulator PdtaR
MARPLDALGLRAPRRAIMPTILIVEDDPAILESVTDIAREGGYLVASARDADEALSLLERGGISVVLTDLQMPGLIDGFALVRRVAQQWPDVALIIMSGWVRPFPGTLPAGAEFLGKPFKEEALATLLIGAA